MVGVDYAIIPHFVVYFPLVRQLGTVCIIHNYFTILIVLNTDSAEVAQREHRLSS